MFQATVSRTADEILRECRRRGLVIKLDTVIKTPRAGGIGISGSKGFRGVLEVTDAGGEVSLKVAANRDGGWAIALARALAEGDDEKSDPSPH